MRLHGQQQCDAPSRHWERKPCPCEVLQALFQCHVRVAGRVPSWKPTTRLILGVWTCELPVRLSNAAIVAIHPLGRHAYCLTEGAFTRCKYPLNREGVERLVGNVPASTRQVLVPSFSGSVHKKCCRGSQFYTRTANPHSRQSIVALQ